MAVHDLADRRPRLADATRKIFDAFVGLFQMIEQLHAAYVPSQGTQCKRLPCPTGALGEVQRHRHSKGMLPNNVPHYRKLAGLTQKGLGERIGTTRDYIAKLERGDKPLTPDWLEKIGGALNIEPYLLIAPDNILPNEMELAELIAAAQQTLPAGLPYSEWPRAIASGLHMRLRMLAGDRASASN